LFCFNFNRSISSPSTTPAGTGTTPAGSPGGGISIKTTPDGSAGSGGGPGTTTKDTAGGGTTTKDTAGGGTTTKDTAGGGGGSTPAGGGSTSAGTCASALMVMVASVAACSTFDGTNGARLPIGSYGALPIGIGSSWFKYNLSNSLSTSLLVKNKPEINETAL